MAKTCCKLRCEGNFGQHDQDLLTTIDYPLGNLHVHQGFTRSGHTIEEKGLMDLTFKAGDNGLFSHLLFIG